ncbi:MAG: hypothetical protein M5U26_22280 [Planctomycetota bacterium]|nr:hypothetical protein [Planctomycetota bacterium]
MKLEWFRDHQSKLWYIVAPLVILSMVLFTPTGKEDGGGGVTGPTGTFVSMEGKTHTVSPTELFTMRRLLTQFSPPQAANQGYLSREALHHRMKCQLVRDMGFEVGKKELTESIRNQIKGRTGKDEVTPQRYETMLGRMEMSKGEFEDLVLDFELLGKFDDVMRLASISDADLYVFYCMQKEKVRLLYKPVRATEYLSQVEKPSAEDLQAYYEKNKDLPATRSGSLYTEARLSADALFIGSEDIDKLIAPADKDLEEYYEKYRTLFWPDDKGGFKPFADVKDDVAKRYKKDKRGKTADEQFEKWGKELAEEMAKLKPEAGEFDWAGFAKARGLTWWRTKPLTQAEYRDGKEEVSAENFKGAVNLYRMAEKAADEEEEKLRAAERDKLQAPRRINHFTDNEGFVALRIASFDPQRLKTLEEAKDLIEKNLIVDRACDKAREAAEALKEKWAAGEELPDPKNLEDEIFDEAGTNPLYRAFRAKPQPAGTILEVADDFDPDEVKKDPKTRLHYYLVGYAVERIVPAWEAFEKDSTFNRTQRRIDLTPYYQYYQRQSAQEYLIKIGKPRTTGPKDPPLYSRGS